MTETDLPSEIQRSSRDLALLRAGLQEWLARVHPGAEITDFETTSATGMSSDTILFDASWDEGGGPQERRLVARVAPSPDDVPVFPSYDLTRQFHTIKAVAQHTDVPVPTVYIDEPDTSIIGTQFFLMGRVDGLVPPDVLPYNFGNNWLFDATPEQQRHLQDTTVDLLARLHEMAPPTFLEFDEPGETALRRHVAHTRAWYEWVAAAATRSPLIDQAFAWLDEHRPHESPAVLSWGDSRIGNIMYRDFEPVAVLDWEMAGVGPRELDLAWCIYAHRGFEDILRIMNMPEQFPGMPSFMQRDDVVARYVQASGYDPRDLDWYETYAALQFAIVYLRVGTRAVHFGEREMPADVDELLYNREPLQRMIGGTYF